MARILIAGGSLGGLMAANLLCRDGHEIVVLEKAAGAMDGRGAGIVTHAALVAGLQRCGMDGDTVLGVAVDKRVTLDHGGEVLAELAMPQVLTSWSRLYHLLHGLLPESCYRQGVTLQQARQHATGVHALTTAGTFDAELLVAADGIRSAVRNQLWPQIEPQYAGYVAWRGVCDEALLSRRTLDSVFGCFGFCLPPGEQLIGYPVAGPGNRTGVGLRAYNFVWYRPAPAPERLEALLTDADGVHHAQGIAPHKVSWREIAQMRSDARALLAPQFAEMIEKTAQPFLQPIHDLASDSIAQDRVCLIGDAAFVARPHVGMGVTKAMQDAVALAEAVRVHGATPAALHAYQEARLGPGQDVVARGRRLGAYMQSSGQQGAPAQQRSAATVMQETAIDLERSASTLPCSPAGSPHARAAASALTPALASNSAPASAAAPSHAITPGVGASPAPVRA